MPGVCTGTHKGTNAMSIYATLWQLRFPRKGDAVGGRLCNALREDGPRLVAEIFAPGSAPMPMFDDGSTTVVPDNESSEE